MEMLIIEILMYMKPRRFFFVKVGNMLFSLLNKIKLSFYKRTHISSYPTSSGIIIEPFCNDCWDYFQNILICVHHSIKMNPDELSLISHMVCFIPRD